MSRAHDRDLGRDIAIKELISRDNVHEMRFLREALITARLEHPGIVPIYEAGRWPDGVPFYAMKLVAGRSLRDLLAERSTIAERIGLLHHVIAVADAMAYAHDRNIIHRDLKPANVIVGKFGETIVIDWGLAKDLTATETCRLDAGPFRSVADDELTSAGSVLGTPAYMAPEQQRGEPADQRADVHAIGVMLWELCTLRKLPPSYAGQRNRILRRSGIDQDLATIIQKALDPDPDRRYQDAGALAADLKAFKAGARIAARSYSMPAILGHWIRRHRAAALSLFLVATLTTVGAVTYVRHIGGERDRASTAKNALVLEHADLLLRSDPTSALALLNDYNGDATPRWEMLRAEARGLGVAQLRAKPHALPVYFARPVPDGAVVTLGADGIVAKTSSDGTSRVVAQSTPDRYLVDYAEARHLLAFACPTTTICLLDVNSERLLPPPSDISFAALAGLSLSPSGELLGALSDRGKVSVWDINKGATQVSRFQIRAEHNQSLAFIDELTLVVQTREGLQMFRRNVSVDTVTELGALSISDITKLSTSSKFHLVAVGTRAGHLVIIDSLSGQIKQEQAVCKGSLNKVAVLAERAAIAYACQDGDVGVWDSAHDSAIVYAHIEGGGSSVSGSTDGRYLVAGGNTGALVAYDYTTGISSWYLGNTARITALLAPTPTFPYIVAANSDGEMNIWPLRNTSVQAVIATAASMFMTAQLPSNGTVLAVSNGQMVAWYTLAGVAGQTPGHSPGNSAIAVASNHPDAVIYGADDELELWSFEHQPSLRRLKTGHGTAIAVAYRYDGAHFVVASKDGSLVEWTADGASSEQLATIREPIAYMRRIPGSEEIAIGGTSGAIWITGRQTMRFLGSETELVASVVISPDARWLATASVRGVVRLREISTGMTFTSRSPHASNAFLEFLPDSSTLAVATGKTISMITLPDATTKARVIPNDGRRWSWSKIELSTGGGVFSPDNEWFAATALHGGIWFNRRGDPGWVYLSIGKNRIMSGSFSVDSRRFAAADAGGRALLIDMQALSNSVAQ